MIHERCVTASHPMGCREIWCQVEVQMELCAEQSTLHWTDERSSRTFFNRTVQQRVGAYLRWRRLTQLPDGLLTRPHRPAFLPSTWGGRSFCVVYRNILAWLGLINILDPMFKVVFESRRRLPFSLSGPVHFRRLFLSTSGVKKCVIPG